MAKSSNILIGLVEITSYIGVSVPTFKSLVKAGLPASVIDGKWYAHAANIDEYFKRTTLLRVREIDEKAE